MGGFEWYEKFDASLAEGVKSLKDEILELCHSDKDDNFRWFLREISDLTLIEHNTSHEESHYYTTKEDGTKEPYHTYYEMFGHEWPTETEIAVYCDEVPWIYKLSAHDKARVASLFEKHGVLEIWWAMIGDSGCYSGMMDRFYSQHGKEIFGQDIVSIERVRPPRE